MICSYGCGKEAKFYFKTVNKCCCSDNWTKCSVMREVKSEILKGKRSGVNNPRYGMKQTEETKRKIGESKLGKPRSAELKRKLSDLRKGKSYEELLGKDKADETKRKISKSGKGKVPWNKGIPHTEEEKAKISNYHKINGTPFKNKKHSNETKEIMKSKWTDERRNKSREEMKNGKAKYIASFVKSETYEKFREVMLNGHAAYMNSFIKNPSKPQVHLYNLVLFIYPDTILNFSETRVNRCIDIAIPEHMIAIEYDGSYWHQDKEADLHRQNILESLGWKFIRYIDYIPSKDKLYEDIENAKCQRTC